MNTYLITLIDLVTGEMQKIIVQANSPAYMQEIVDRKVISDPSFTLKHPRVMDINPYTAAHIRAPAERVVLPPRRRSIFNPAIATNVVSNLLGVATMALDIIM